ncbi:MAG: type II toxin-antitoxin system PemK/MazF family toxin [Fidelibacterota bacterium]
MNYYKGDVVLFPYPFTNLNTKKVRPAVIISNQDVKYTDVFIVPLTSKTFHLSDGEFVLSKWQQAGLNIETAVKRGCYLANSDIILKKVGELVKEDLNQIENSLKIWLDLK